MNYTKAYPKIIGLTGAIASGKNAVAQIFSKQAIEVFDADLIVHDLYQKNSFLIGEIEKLYPQTIVNKAVDRNILAKLINNSPAILQNIENLVHPVVFQKYQEFLDENRQKNAKLAILNIPLLQENNNYKTDIIIAVIANKDLRLMRYLKRENKNFSNDETQHINFLTNKFILLNQKQLSDEERIKNANYIIHNQGNFSDLEAQVHLIYQQILQNL